MVARLQSQKRWLGGKGYIGPSPRGLIGARGPRAIFGIFWIFGNFRNFRFFALYGILGKTDLCKRMPRGMPSFSTIACLILTTFQNFRFPSFSDLMFARFPYSNLNFSCPLINQPLFPWERPSVELYFPWVSRSVDSWAPISWYIIYDIGYIIYAI